MEEQPPPRTQTPLLQLSLAATLFKQTIDGLPSITLKDDVAKGLIGVLDCKNPLQIAGRSNDWSGPGLGCDLLAGSLLD